MRFFIAASYSSQVNYDTGDVFPEYKEWLEDNLQLIESHGHTVFCALRADNYKINDANPAEAFKLDEAEIDSCDAFLAFVTDKVSAGVQTEIGMAIAKNKKVYIAHAQQHELSYFNQAIVLASQAKDLVLPITAEMLPAA